MLPQNVNEYLVNAAAWREEAAALRAIALDCGLDEAIKWRNPCYSFNGNNIVLMGGFISYFGFSFFKGVLLSDNYGLLHSPGENSQSVRMFKFVNVNEIMEREMIIKEYVAEAVKLYQSGVLVDLTQRDRLVFPVELIAVFNENPRLKKSFEALTPGRQRGYNIYFSGSANAKTRTSRIEKYIDRIQAGKGLNDCTCGLSKKMPSCDGSHKYL
jgi:uncharacterized protein YdeI (YjbR/CyaY-like superfamily)